MPPKRKTNPTTKPAAEPKPKAAKKQTKEAQEPLVANLADVKKDAAMKKNSEAANSKSAKPAKKKESKPISTKVHAESRAPFHVQPLVVWPPLPPAFPPASHPSALPGPQPKADLKPDEDEEFWVLTPPSKASRSSLDNGSDDEDEDA